MHAHLSDPMTVWLIRLRPWVLGVFVLAACASVTGCGDDTEQRVANERADAAEQARIEERVRNLESDLQEAKKRAGAADRRARDAQRKAEQGGNQSAGVSDTKAPAEDRGAGSDDAPTGDWPGGPGFTAVLASETSVSAARGIQKQATTRGLDAGVLYSTDYSSLRPGYWVVFSGTFPNQSDAARRASRAKELGYGTAYPRFVSP